MVTPADVRRAETKFLDNVSALNLGKLFAQLIHADRMLTPAEKRLAESVMNTI